MTTTPSAEQQLPSSPIETNNEEIDGIEPAQPGGWGDYPLDSLAIRSEHRAAVDVVRRINNGRFVMDPEFQRDFVWDKKKQSRLIESALLRIPLPVIYVAEDQEGRLVVVDGRQRLTTFDYYINDKLRLDLPDRQELHGKRFSELPLQLQSRVEDCQLMLYIIDAKVPDRARLDIFERVNSGELLTRQQMRNCIYSGKATQFVKEEAEQEGFKEATGHSLKASTMRDREFVNRFVSFRLLPLSAYKDNDMDGWLAEGLKRVNSQTDPEIEALRAAFRRSMFNNHTLFGKHAFRKFRPNDDAERRSILNASLFDVMSVLLADVQGEVIRSKHSELVSATLTLFNDQTFSNAITYGPNGGKEVRYRFDAARRAFQVVLDAP